MRGDYPIDSASEDKLGRASIAARFVRQTLSLDATVGVVVGVQGSWGSGKTSFLNLAGSVLAKSSVTVVRFNPWLFSGTRHLLGAYFHELEQVLSNRPLLARIGERLGRYGKVLSELKEVPVIGGGLGLAGAAGKAAGLAAASEGLSQQREALAALLLELPKPIVVMIDDIDRLEDEEIRAVLRLVRLVGSFPNLVYVVAFDREVVLRALRETGGEGYGSFLDKVFQLSIDLPRVPAPDLMGLCTSALDETIADFESSGGTARALDEGAWPDILGDIVLPLVRTMRDLRRLGLALLWALHSVGSNVALADLIAIEAIRVLDPPLYAKLVRRRDLLAPSGLLQGRVPDSVKKAVRESLDHARLGGEFAARVIGLLFPAAVAGLPEGNEVFGLARADANEPRMLRERRIGHPDVFATYLEGVSSAGVAVQDAADRLWGASGSATTFAAAFEQTRLDVRLGAIAALEAYEGEFLPGHAEWMVPFLLNALPELPSPERSFFSLRKSVMVTRVTLRLLRAAAKSHGFEPLVRQIIDDVKLLSGQLDVIYDVGSRPNVGHALLDSSAVTSLELEWVERVRASDAEVLSAEPALLLVIDRAAELAKEHGVCGPDTPSDPALLRSLFASSRGEVVSRYVGSAAESREVTLDWTTLQRVFGDESSLGEAARIVIENVDDPRDELATLIERYLDGWRPGAEPAAR